VPTSIFEEWDYDSLKLAGMGSKEEPSRWTRGHVSAQLMLPVQAGAALDKMTSRYGGGNTEKVAMGKAFHGCVSNFSYALLCKSG